MPHHLDHPDHMISTILELLNMLTPRIKSLEVLAPDLPSAYRDYTFKVIADDLKNLALRLDPPSEAPKA